MFLIAGFLTGLLGGLHCIGMCGPIVMALRKDENAKKDLFNKAIYNTGRVVTYGFLGLAAGIFGGMFEFYGMQQIVSVVTGILIIVFVAIGFVYTKRVLNVSIFQKPINFLKSKLSYFLKMKSKTSFFLLGILNGFLPCGLVYLALAGAFVVSEPLLSSAYMMLFGIGTFPAMMLFGAIILKMKQKFNINFNKFIPVFSLILAVIFILRGLNLGIPMISPHLKTDKSVENHLQEPCCH